jgi:hypothetical protein
MIDAWKLRTRPKPQPPKNMPNVGLFTASEPVSPDTALSIRYSVEVGGLPVYTELYDVRRLLRELDEDREESLAVGFFGDGVDFASSQGFLRNQVYAALSGLGGCDAKPRALPWASLGRTFGP